MSVNLYLHIGDGKTGSSAIQNFLDVNRELLFNQHGYLYPNFLALSYEKGRCHNHASWFGGKTKDPKELISDLLKMVDFCEKKGIKHAVMSNEAWMGRFKSRMNKIMSKTLQQNSSIKPTIICYVRRLDSWTESFWKQWGIKKFADIDAFLEDRDKNSGKNVLQVLEAWEEVVGRENIVVRPYEKGQLKDGLIADFLEVIGINYKDHSWAPVENTNLAMNKGFKRDVLEVLHMCRDLTEGVHDHRIFELFYDLLGPKFYKEPFEKYQLFSPQQRLALLQKNKPVVEEIARRYMGREDGDLFYEPWPDENEAWEEYEGLTIEKVVPILIQMIFIQQQKINKLELEYSNKVNFLDKQIAKFKNTVDLKQPVPQPAVKTTHGEPQSENFKQKFKKSSLYGFLKKIYHSIK